MCITYTDNGRESVLNPYLWHTKHKFLNYIKIILSYILCKAFRPALVLVQPPFRWVQGALSIGAEQPQCEVDYSPLYSKGCVKLYLHSPICLYGMHRNNFTPHIQWTLEYCLFMIHLRTSHSVLRINIEFAYYSTMKLTYCKYKWNLQN